MFTLSKCFLATLIVSIAFVSGDSESLMITNVETNIVKTNPAQDAVLTQLKTTKSDTGNPIYSYICTVGSYNSSRLACTVHDNIKFSSAQDFQARLRCPSRGTGPTLSYVEINFSVSSPHVNCVVNEGDIGLGYIVVTVKAWNTVVFNYLANFYSY